MVEWRIVESEAEQESKQESYLVLCQIRHETKKRKKIGDPPLSSAAPSTVDPSPSLPLDSFDGLLNHEGIDEIMGPSEEMGSIEEMFTISHIDHTFTGSES